MCAATTVSSVEGRELRRLKPDHSHALCFEILERLWYVQNLQVAAIVHAWERAAHIRSAVASALLRAHAHHHIKDTYFVRV
jgi:hypothetical protein